jgi:hypothetical protein
MDFNMLTNVKGYCFPAFIFAMFQAYLVIVTLTLDAKDKTGKPYTMKDKILTALLEVICGIIIMYCMLILCKKGYEEYAWVLLLAPLVLHLLNKKMKCN